MIAVDWGSSTLRAFRLDAVGKIVAQRRTQPGVMSSGGRFETTLKEQITGWDDPLIVLAGMVGSRQGWLEVPYVECPATLADVAAGMRRMDAPSLPDRAVWIVPGLVYHGATQSDTDLLRGEETQLFGLLDGASGERQLVCMPGTHSKWVVATHARVEAFLTAMTGELYELLCTHSLLGRLMPERHELFDEFACKQGIERARAAGGVLQHLFSVRTAGLLGGLESRQLASYLSGLLIAHEVLDCPWAAQFREQRVQLVGSSTVLEPYAYVMRYLGMRVDLHDEMLSATGAHVLAKHRGLLR